MMHRRRADLGGAPRSVPRTCLAAAGTAIALLAPSPVPAMPQAPAVVCDVYPTSSACTGQLPACTVCHTVPPVRNAFGVDVEAGIAPGAPRPLAPARFSDELPAALMGVEHGDSDGDGFDNLDELLSNSAPADPDSRPTDGERPACESPRTARYDVCDRDPAYTFAKVMRDVCGRSPRMDELAALSRLADPWQHIHATLDTCLASEHWRGRDGVLWNLANRKIRPTASIKAGRDPGAIPLADYDDDYNLFVYTQTGDRDARELLTARYMVRRRDGGDGAATTYKQYTRTPLEDLLVRGPFQAQLVVPSRRAGMITTRWFLITNTMFTAIPRTSAAQAYRAYLGMDIASLQGLMPVANEPADHDAKSVDRPECAVCHATLDPLSYPFTRYDGLGDIARGALPASYDRDRLERFVDELAPDVDRTPEAGVIFGQPVEDLVAWARVAADSDAFARATALDYWQLLLGEPPRARDQDAFEALWQAFRGEHGYRVEPMLHQLIEMEAYSVP